MAEAKGKEVTITCKNEFSFVQGHPTAFVKVLTERPFVACEFAWDLKYVGYYFDSSLIILQIICRLRNSWKD